MPPIGHMVINHVDNLLLLFLRFEILAMCLIGHVANLLLLLLLLLLLFKFFF
jgi:hypothetical protein